jgi:hypothetical protein
MSSKFMSIRTQADLFGEEPQTDLFGTEAAPAYRPSPERVRARLHHILTELRSTESFPLGSGRPSLYRTIFPQLTLFLPKEEAAQLRLDFEGEMARIQAAA